MFLIYHDIYRRKCRIMHNCMLLFDNVLMPKTIKSRIGLYIGSCVFTDFKYIYKLPFLINNSTCRENVSIFVITQCLKFF